jgi:hypothetical protein
MKKDDIIIILGLQVIILLVGGLYFFPSEALLEAIRISGF